MKQNRVQKYTYTDTWFMTKVALQKSGEKIIFSMNGARYLDIYIEKSYSWPSYLTPYIKKSIVSE